MLEAERNPVVVQLPVIGKFLKLAGITGPKNIQQVIIRLSGIRTEIERMDGAILSEGPKSSHCGGVKDCEGKEKNCGGYCRQEPSRAGLRLLESASIHRLDVRQHSHVRRVERHGPGQMRQPCPLLNALQHP